jgi:hypothetical protein
VEQIPRYKRAIPKRHRAGVIINPTKMNAKVILNATAFVLAVTGILLTATYMAGGRIAIILSAATMMVTLFMFALKDNREAGVGNGLNYFLTGSLVFLITGLIFKIQHWPGAGMFVQVSYPLVFILPVALLLQKGDFRISKQFVTTFFIFFILVVSIFIRENPIAQHIGKGWDHPLATETAPDINLAAK